MPAGRSVGRPCAAGASPPLAPYTPSTRTSPRATLIPGHRVGQERVSCPMFSYDVNIMADNNLYFGDNPWPGRLDILYRPPLLRR